MPREALFMNKKYFLSFSKHASFSCSSKHHYSAQELLSVCLSWNDQISPKNLENKILINENIIFKSLENNVWRVC